MIFSENTFTNGGRIRWFTLKNGERIHVLFTRTVYGSLRYSTAIVYARRIITAVVSGNV